MSEQPLILIVDDEPAFLEIFGTKLTSVGYRVEASGSGEEGIKKAKEMQPDLILLDVKMPKMTGAEALLKLKEDPATKDIKVVFLTGFGDPLDEAGAIGQKFSQEFGAQGYLKKTEDLDTLVDRIKSFLP